MKNMFNVIAKWDDEAEVYVATSDDVRGLVTESEDLNQLIEKLKIMIPELLAEHGNHVEDEINFVLTSERRLSTDLSRGLKQLALIPLAESVLD